jgi:hypothetical protein
MNKKEKSSRVFQVRCPCCQAMLWVDSVTQEVMKFDRAKKEKGSLDSLLEKEKKRRSEFEQKFEATAELQKERKKKAKEQFEKALTNFEKDE